MTSTNSPGGCRGVRGSKAWSVSYIDWALTETKRLKVERATRKKAVCDAQRRAQDYADALDLGKVVVRGHQRPRRGQAGADGARDGGVGWDAAGAAPRSSFCGLRTWRSPPRWKPSSPWRRGNEKSCSPSLLNNQR